MEAPNNSTTPPSYDSTQSTGPSDPISIASIESNLANLALNQSQPSTRTNFFGTSRRFTWKTQTSSQPQMQNFGQCPQIIEEKTKYVEKWFLSLFKEETCEYIFNLLCPLWKVDFSTNLGCWSTANERWELEKNAIVELCINHTKSLVLQKHKLSFFFVCLMFPTVLPTYIKILISNSNLYEKKIICILLESFLIEYRNYGDKFEYLNLTYADDIASVREYVEISHELRSVHHNRELKIFYEVFKIFGERMAQCAKDAPSFYQVFKESFINFYGCIPFEKENQPLQLFFDHLMEGVKEIYTQVEKSYKEKKGMDENDFPNFFVGTKEKILQHLYDCFNPPVSDTLFGFIMTQKGSLSRIISPTNLKLLAKAVFMFKIEEFKSRSLSLMPEIGASTIPCLWFHRVNGLNIFTPLLAMFQLGFLSRIHTDVKRATNQFFSSLGIPAKKDKRGRLVVESLTLDRLKEDRQISESTYIYYFNGKPFIILETAQDDTVLDQSNQEEASSSRVTENKLDESVQRPLLQLKEWLKCQSEDERRKFCEAFKAFGELLQTSREVKYYFNTHFSRLLTKYKGWMNFRNEHHELSVVFLRRIDKITRDFCLTTEQRKKMFSQMYQCFLPPSSYRGKSIENVRKELLNLPKPIRKKMGQDLFELSPIIANLKLKEFVQRTHLIPSQLRSSKLPCLWMKTDEECLTLQPLQLEFDNQHFLRKVSMNERDQAIQTFSSIFSQFSMSEDSEVFILSEHFEDVIEKLETMLQSSSTETSFVLLYELLEEETSQKKEEETEALQDVWMQNNLSIIHHMKELIEQHKAQVATGLKDLVSEVVLQTSIEKEKE